MIQIDNAAAFSATRLLSRAIGLSVVGTTGAVFAAIKSSVAKQGKDAVVGFFVGDRGIRYMTKVFSDEWMKQNQFDISEENITNAISD